LKASDFPISALVKWILSVSLNIHTLSLNNRAEKLNIFLNEIGCLKKLKELKVFVDSSSELIEVTIIVSGIMTTMLISSQIVRSCRQMEILRMRVTFLTREDLVKLEPAENKTDITLRWQVGPSIEEVLSVLKRWRQLRRLTLRKYRNLFSHSEYLAVL